MDASDGVRERVMGTKGVVLEAGVDREGVAARDEIGRGVLFCLLVDAVSTRTDRDEC